MNNSRRGAALLISLYVLVILGGLGVVLSMQSIQEGQLVTRLVSSSRAFWLAEAGLQQGVWDINYNHCGKFRLRENDALCGNCETCGAGERYYLAPLGSGEFEVVTDEAMRSLVSTGYVPSKASSTYKRRLRVELGGAQLFGFAAYAQDSINIGQSVTIDSYNSGRGVYGVGNVNDQGDIGTNGSAVTVGANTKIQGDFSTGSGDVALEHGGSVTGQVSQGGSVPLPVVTVPADLAAATYLGELFVSFNTEKTINSGDYRYSAISLEDNAQLHIKGVVRFYLTAATALELSNNASIVIEEDSSLQIYTDGTISVLGNAALTNLTERPESLSIYSTYSGENGIVIDNDTSVLAAIYAPQTDIIVNNDQGFFGALVGRSIDLGNNTEFHYDESLGNISGSSPGYPHNWVEL